MSKEITRATITQSAAGSPAISTTQINKREVGDVIRFLGKSDNLFAALIEGILFDPITGKEIKKPGLISKKPASQFRFEMETQAPYPDSTTVSSGTEVESSGIVVASANGIYIPMTMYNTRNKTMFRVEYISGTTLKGASVGTTFAAQAGDTLLFMSIADKEGQDTPPILTASPSNNFNILQNAYWSTKIADTANKIEYLAHEPGASSRKDDLVKFVKRHILNVVDRTLLFGSMSADYATKNTTTGIQSGYTDEFSTTKGIYNLAANEFDALGGLDWSTWKRDIPGNLSETVSDNDMLICLCGNQTYSHCPSAWLDANSQIHIASDSKSMLDKFGWKTNKFITDGPTVEFIKHEAFDKGDLVKQMLIFNPKLLRYRYMEGMDFTDKPNIQTNAARAEQHGIYATFGIETLDAGNSILRVLNAW